MEICKGEKTVGNSWQTRHLVHCDSLIKFYCFGYVNATQGSHPGIILLLAARKIFKLFHYYSLLQVISPNLGVKKNKKQ